MIVAPIEKGERVAVYSLHVVWAARGSCLNDNGSSS
jgi:hypothetical protein